MDYATLSDLNDALVRKALTGSLFAAPYDSDAVTAANLFDVDRTLAALPAGYVDGGLTSPEGIRFARAVETDDIPAWQRTEPARTDIVSDTETLQVDFEETNRRTIELYTGADLTGAALVNGALSIKKPAQPPGRYYRLLALAVDIIDGEEFYVGRVYPKVKVTNWADQAFARAGALRWGMTFTTYVDPVLGYSKDDILGGPGYAAVSAAMGLPVPAPLP